MPCPQCGQPVTIGAPACPTCGLRFGVQVERGRPGGNAPQGGREASFDDGMPGWLRQIQGGPGGQPPQAPQPYQPPASQLPANSLMSGDALPGWLREVGAAPAAPNPYAPPAQAQMPPNYPSRMPQQPQWPQQMAPDPRDPRQQRIPSPGGAAIASNALFDEASLPEWLRQSGGQGVDQPTIQQVPGYAPPGRAPLNGASPYAPPAPNGYLAAQPSAQSAFPSLDQAVAPSRGLPSPAISPVPQGDGGALPGWLGGGMQPPDSGQRGGAAGMAAQSLIDETALPTWLRSQPQTRQGQLAQPANPPSVAWDAPPLPASQWNQPAGYTPQSPAPQQVGAGSFVDDGALPGWLRAQSGGQPSPGAGYGPMNAAPQNAGMDGGYRPAGGAQGTLPKYGPGDPAEHAPGQFSASDLIDPQALPGWVQRTGDAQASFSSSAGWSVQQPTARQPRPDAAELASRGATGRQPAYDAYGERDASPQREEPAPRERGRQTGAYPAASNQIPPNELPPWLQGAPSAGAGRGRPGSYEGQPPAQPNGQRGRRDDPFQDEWDDPDYDAAPYQEPYPGELDAGQQGYGEAYDARYGYDPGQEQGYADEYDGAPPPRGRREQRYGVGSEEAYGDPDYDGVDSAWQQQENDERGDGKRGGWRRFFGRR